MSPANLDVRTEQSDPYCLSAGTGGPSPGYDHAGWCDRVLAALRGVRPDLAYLNTAVIGATTEQTLAGQVETMRRFAPDLLHVPSGANDIWRREPSFPRIRRGLHELFSVAAATSATVTTFTLGNAFVIDAYPDFPERVRRVNDIVRSVAEHTGVHVVEMWRHPIMSRGDLLSADGVHFAASGQAVMAAEVVRTLSAALGARQ